jgi:alkylation response protein AidB-like acyl-CoA dehydrogenase
MRCYGRKLARFDTILQDIARSRCDIECARLLLHKAAEMMDEFGNKDARTRQALA